MKQLEDYRTMESPNTPPPMAGLNLITPYNERQVALIAICSAFGAMALAAVGLRWSIRISKRMRPSAGDYIALFALTVLILTRTVAIYGYGQHLTVVLTESPQNIVYILKLTIAGGFIWGYATGAAKISLLLLYLNIFPGKKTRTACWITIGAILVFETIYTITLALSCVPMRHLWDQTVPGTCENIWDAEMFACVCAIFFDLIIIAIPQPVVWKLKASRNKRLSVSLIFSFGILVIVTTILRLYYVIIAEIGPGSSDLTYTNWPVLVLAVLEVSLSTTCASLPTLGSLTPLMHDGFRRTSNTINTSLRSLQRVIRSGASRSSRSSSERNNSQTSDEEYTVRQDSFSKLQQPTTVGTAGQGHEMDDVKTSREGSYSTYDHKDGEDIDGSSNDNESRNVSVTRHFGTTTIPV